MNDTSLPASQPPAIDCPLYVLITGNDEYPTWIPGTLPMWTSQEAVDTFVVENGLDAESAELMYGSQLLELAADLQHVGCHSVAVDAVDFTVDVPVMPIDQLITDLGVKQ